MVSPKLEYSEMGKLQEVVRCVKNAGAFVNSSCGMHVHVDASNHTPRSLKNALTIMYCKEDILFKALNVQTRRQDEYCQKVRPMVLEKIRRMPNSTITMEKFKRAWYEGNDGSSEHYNWTRYYALNLHAVFSKGTLEWRCFESTLHAGKVRSNITLALAISAQAINQSCTHAKKTEIGNNPAFTFRTFLLRLGLIGDEYKNVRKHLLANLDGDKAWRYDKKYLCLSARIQDGQMMRDNRIMRTDRPGGNIRLFLCKMKKKKKEVENMKSKYRFRRILSGVMAAVTILSTVISPLTVYASEEPKAAEPPAYESVKDQLDENEVVKATDLELEVGQDFDVSTDFTNLEIKDESKVKVTFQKAENDAGENFSTSHADTYHAVYYVEPVNQNHPVYQIGRNLIVKEPVTAAQSEPQTEQAVTEEDTGSDDEEAASQEETETVPVETEIVEPETAESETEEPEETEPEFQDGLSESEFDAALEESETENTTDEESGLTLSDVLEQAGEQDIDLMAMEDGGKPFHSPQSNTSTRATQDVDVTRGAAYYYADYGLGSYVNL